MKVAVIMDPSFGAHHASVEADGFWMLDTPENRPLGTTLIREGKYDANSALFKGGSYSSGSEMAIEILSGIIEHHPEWETIEFIGLQPDLNLLANIIAPGGVPSGLYPSETPTGFQLAKSPPQVTSDQKEIWRQRLPEKADIQITEQAARSILEHLSLVQNEEPGKDWIPALVWGPRSVKRHEEAEWRDLGIGFSLGFYYREQVPIEAIEVFGEIEIVIMNSSGDPSAFDGKKVDFGEGEFNLVPA